MDKRNIVIGLLLTLSVVSVIAVITTININNQLTRLEKRIDHLDEDVDEAGTNIKKLLSHETVSGTAEKISKAQAKADVREHDFGKIKKENGKVYADFTIANTGTDPLMIGEIVTSCGCTTATITEKSIAPEKNATLTVTFDPNFHEEPQGRFSRVVFVPTNDQNTPELSFTIFMEIIN